MKKKIAFLITHPIQYYSPLFRYLQANAGFDIKVFYQSSCSIVGNLEKEFGRVVRWDTDLLGGYDHEFLPSIGSNNTMSRWKPWCYGLHSALKSGKFEALILLGYNRPFHWYAIWLSWRLGLKVFIRDDSNSFSKQRGGFKNFLKRFFFNLIVRSGADFLAVGKANHAYYTDHGVPLARIHLMHWAVDTEFFKTLAEASRSDVPTLREALGIADAQIVFLFVGKLSYRKGIDTLLRAFLSAYKDLSDKPALVFVGDGELRDKVEAAAKECPDIKVVGFKNQTQLPEYYELCDALILPSLTLETWGLVVNEVMSVGKPAIVSDQVGCWPDLIIEGATGWRFPADDYRQLEERITNFVKNQFFDKERIASLMSEYSFAQNLECLESAV